MQAKDHNGEQFPLQLLHSALSFTASASCAAFQKGAEEELSSYSEDANCTGLPG